MEGVEENNPDDCVLPKVRPEPKEEVDPTIEEPKIEGEEPNAGALPPPKIEDEVLEPNPETLGAPNSEGLEDVEPKGLAEDEENGELKSEVDDDPNPAEPKDGVLGANGFEEVVDEKGFVAA